MLHTSGKHLTFAPCFILKSVAEEESNIYIWLCERLLSVSGCNVFAVKCITCPLILKKYGPGLFIKGSKLVIIDAKEQALL